MLCSKCGKLVHEGAKYCEICGSGLPADRVLGDGLTLSEKTESNKYNRAKIFQTTVLCVALTLFIFAAILSCILRITFDEQTIEESLFEADFGIIVQEIDIIDLLNTEVIYDFMLGKLDEGALVEYSTGERLIRRGVRAVLERDEIRNFITGTISEYIDRIWECHSIYTEKWIFRAES